MNPVTDIVRNFFQEYERDINTPDPTLVASRYHVSFMFAAAQGAQAVKKDDFLQVLPKRAGFFKTVGLTATTIQSLAETRLDDSYVLVKATWKMQFAKEGTQPIVTETAATYILHQQGETARIVFQLDHHDLMKRVQELGLLPTPA